MIMGYIRLGMAAVSAAGWLTKLLLWAGLAAALLAAYGVWHHKVYQRGVDDTIAAIAREDAKFIDRARAARSKWKDCRDQGHGWDQSTGRCL